VHVFEIRLSLDLWEEQQSSKCFVVDYLTEETVNVVNQPLFEMENKTQELVLELMLEALVSEVLVLEEVVVSVWVLG
jgi:hypothetical protein